MEKDFSELFKYLNEQFTHIDQRFDYMKKEFSDLQDSVDGFARKADVYFQEMLILAHKVDRHEKWMHQIAEKVGVKLEY